MIKRTFTSLAEITGGKLHVRDAATTAAAETTFTGVSTDSRTLEAGELFVAIRGERHDGHRYLAQALERGAAGVLIDERFAAGATAPMPANAVVVPDSHAAMITLARHYLASLDVTSVGITGSNGKTTTKEFTYRLLRSLTANVYHSPGNFNNLFGIPLALFAMPESTRVAVLEMGISTPGEMSRLADIVRPDIVAITNISPTHLEFLGTVEAIAREKLELHRRAADDAPLVINADDDLLMREAAATGDKDKTVTFGITHDADFRPNHVEPTSSGSTVVQIENDRFEIPLFGHYQVYNLLAAYAIVRSLGFDFSRVDVESIDLTTAPMRGETMTVGDVTLIADCYNANPDSVKAGLESFAKTPSGGRRGVVLGDMLELGSDAVEFHRAMGRQLAAAGADRAFLVGALTEHTAEAAVHAGMNAAEVYHFASAADCADAVLSWLRPGDTLYLKGSRGIGLEAIIARCKEEGKVA